MNENIGGFNFTEAERPKRRRPFRKLLARQKAHGDSLRDWQQDQAAKAKKQMDMDAAQRRAEAATRRSKKSNELNALRPVVHKPLVEHYGTPYTTRRRSAKVTRIKSIHGKTLRVEREVRGGTNQPYYSPARNLRRR